MKQRIDRALADPEARTAFFQLARYGVIGVAITAGGQAIYYGLAETRTTSPLVAITIAWIVGVTVGYFAHGWISFAGHGARDDHGRVWLLVERLAGPTWWPIVPNIALTPLITFWLHRRWTFG